MTKVGPLDGLRVAEIGGGVAAAFCSRMLRGFGAETVRLEGFETPAERGALDSDQSTFLTTGSTHVRVSDINLTELIDSVDVLIDDQPPGWLAAQGLDPLMLRESQPGLVITSISPFGQTGPKSQWQTTSAVQFAIGGIMGLTGDAHRTPLITGGNQAHFLGGLQGFAATTSALLRMVQTGRGDWIDLSMQECAASMLELYAAMSEYDTKAPVVRSGNSVRSTWGVYRCADGFAGVCCLARQTPTFLSLIGDEVRDDPRFADLLSRAEHDDELLAHVMTFMLGHTKEELIALSPQHRVPFGAVRTPNELLSDATFLERGFFDQIETAQGTVTMPGRPFPGLNWTAPRPRDQDPKTGDAIPGQDQNPTQAWRSRSAPAEPGNNTAPRILDLTMMWAGPYATKLLAETGADVIKIESPSAWDNLRTLIPQDPEIEDPWNSSYYFSEYGHSKRSLTLDLAQPEGRQIFLQLVATADVVIENYRADVLDNLGLGYEVLREVNDDIVLVSMAGFGKTGELRNHVGFGPIIEMMSGLMSLTGYGDDDVPFKTGISYGDPVGGINAVAATNLALIERHLRGTGRHIDLAQRETAATLAGPAFVAASTREEIPMHHGNRHPQLAPQGCYPAAGDDRWLVVSVRDDEDWIALCAVIGRSDLAHLTYGERAATHDELDAAISRWSELIDPEEAASHLQTRGVPAAPVNDTVAIHDDPQLRARGFWVEIDNEKMHPYRQSGPTWRFADRPPSPMRRAPYFGEHNQELLDELGVDEATQADLTNQRVLAQAPINPGVG